MPQTDPSAAQPFPLGDVNDKQSILDAMEEHTMVSITDLSGTIRYANTLFARTSGYSIEELVGRNHRIVQSDQQDAGFWETVWQTIASGNTWRGTLCNRAKDGRPYWVDAVITPAFDSAGNIEKYLSMQTDVTARHQAQLQLNNELADLKAILQGTHAGTWEWEVPTGVTIINARWADIIGYSQAQLGPVTVETWRRMCHPDDLEATNALMARHFAGEIDYFEREFRMRHRAGHWVWVQSRGKVSSWVAPGQPRWVSGIHLDVSAQKLLQNELAQNNRLLESILAHIPVGLSVFGRDLKLVSKNEKFNELLDLPDWLFERPDLTFESLLQFNAARGEYGTGEDVQAKVHNMLRQISQGTQHQSEQVRPNGMVLEVRSAPMPGGGFITTHADISERRQAEAEIAATKNMLQSVLDSASEVGVITIDMSGTITLFNKGAERLLGYDAAQVIGRCTPEIFFDAAEIEARNSSMSALLGRPFSGLQCLVDEHVLGKRNEWTYVHRDGHRFAAALVVTTLTDVSGVRTGYLGVSHDITQEKEHAARLQVAMEMAEQASNAKGQFLANMSHEIRTPMNAILGMLKLMHSTQLDARQLDYASKTESAAKSLLGLLNDILDFSKTEAGKMVLDLQPFSLDALLSDLSVILSANVGTKCIEVMFDLDPALPDALVGDSMRLQQILINLGGNAIKFTESGDVVISVQCLKRNTLDATLRIAVRDSGIGIDPKHQQHIFTGFSQAEASTTRRFGGTGLGLSICRRLIAMMGGELKLQSALGRGSTFYFDLTLALGAAPDTFAPADKPNLHVLLIDDNATARRIFGTLATALGWQLDLADSAAKGLEYLGHSSPLKKVAYSAVFMDWYMADKSAAELAKRIRANAPRVALIAMASAIERESLAAEMAEGGLPIDGFLVKPATASMLRKSLTQALDAGRDGAFPKARNAGKEKRLSGLRILVVEDNPINQQVARELLTMEGAQIDIADNGQLGVNAVAQAKEAYDAVLMDLQMPVMDGLTAAVTIRHELGLHQLPIIAMTANAMASDRESCLAAGMNDHIGKPFELNALVAMLLGYARGTTHADASAAPVAASTIWTNPGEPLSTADEVLDVGVAVERLGGNTELFAQIAGSFLEEISTLPERLEAMFGLADLSAATRTLHTIKGLSSTVGANRLAAICRRAESALKTATREASVPDAQAIAALQKDLLQGVYRTTQALEQAILELTSDQTNPALCAVHGDAASHAPDVEAILAGLKSLQTLLIESDMGAIDAHRQLLRDHARAIGPRLDNLNAAMAAFDFQQGVVQCDVLIREFAASNQQ